jgi:hypothetical protein
LNISKNGKIECIARERVTSLQYCNLMQNYESVSRRFYKRRADVVFAVYIAVVYMHGVFSVISGASSVKIWHPPRTGMEKGSEEGRVRGNEWEGRKPV